MNVVSNEEFGMQAYTAPVHTAAVHTHEWLWIISDATVSTLAVGHTTRKSHKARFANRYQYTIGLYMIKLSSVEFVRSNAARPQQQYRLYIGILLQSTKQLNVLGGLLVTHNWFF